MRSRTTGRLEPSDRGQPSRDPTMSRSTTRPVAIPKPCRATPSHWAIQNPEFIIQNSPNFRDTHGPYQRGHRGRMSWNQQGAFRPVRSAPPVLPRRRPDAREQRSAVLRAARSRPCDPSPARAGVHWHKRAQPRWSEAGARIVEETNRSVARILPRTWQHSGILQNSCAFRGRIINRP